MFGKEERAFRATTTSRNKSKSSPINIFKPSTHPRGSSTSELVSIQQRDKLEAQQVMRFGVGEFAGLVVESDRPEFWTTFQAGPSKAVPLAPFQQATPEKISRIFAAIKAEVRRIVGGPLAQAEPLQAESLANPTPAESAPVPTPLEEEADPSHW